MSELTPEAFRKLLETLDDDTGPDRAVQRYEDLRHRLVVFFEVRSCRSESEDLADETLNRVATKLLNGTQLSSSMSSFCLGVARFVHKEWIKTRKAAEVRSPNPLGLLGRHEADDDGARRRELLLLCFERCLERLTPECRKLILAYYEGEGQGKIDNRRRLAEGLSISQNALRRRTNRIRAQLEASVRRAFDEAILEPTRFQVSSHT